MEIKIDIVKKEEVANRNRHRENTKLAERILEMLATRAPEEALKLHLGTPKEASRISSMMQFLEKKHPEVRHSLSGSTLYVYKESK